MKNILLILFCFIAVAAGAQYIPNATSYQWKGGEFLNSLQIPTNCGAPVTGVNAPDTKRSAIYFDSCNNAFYRFDPKAQSWGPITGGGGGIDTIYVRNDTLYGVKGGKEFFVVKLGIYVNGLNQPGYVTWTGSGLTFDVTAAVYTINNITYRSAAGQVTLNPADATNPRYDVFAVNTSGQIVVLTGTPSANPAVPQIDPNSQVFLTSVYIPAGATVPPNVDQNIIYDENTEAWTGAASSGFAVNFNATSKPYHLTKNVDAPSLFAIRDITFTKTSGFNDAKDYSFLKLFINLNSGGLARAASTLVSSGFFVTFMNGATAVSNNVQLSGYGMSDTTGVYQNVTIPLSAFTFTNSVFNGVRIRASNSGTRFYVDYVQLQQGIAPPPVTGVYQDTTYMRVDSLFGKKNNKEFFIGKAGGGTPSLTSARIAYGNASNLMTGSDSLTYTGGALTIKNNNLLQTANTSGLFLYNPTPATAANPIQNSQMVTLGGNGYNTSVPAQSVQSTWSMYVAPLSNAFGPGNPNWSNLTFINNGSNGVITFGSSGAITAGSVNGINGVQGSTGTFNTVAGAIQLVGGLAYPSSTNFYRTTNAGTDLTPQFYIVPPNTGAGNVIPVIDRTNGLAFAANNDNVPVRAIMRAGIYVRDLINTAGNESGGLGFATQLNGAVAAERMKLTPAGTLTLMAGTASAAPFNIPAGIFRSVPASGDIESDGNNLRWTTSGGVSVNLINGKRVFGITNATTLTPNIATTDAIKITALAGALTINAPTGTPAPMQTLVIRIKDNGTAQTLSWNAIYRNSPNLLLPGTTTAGRTMYMIFYANTDDNTWDFMSLQIF